MGSDLFIRTILCHYVCAALAFCFLWRLRPWKRKLLPKQHVDRARQTESGRRRPLQQRATAVVDAKHREQLGVQQLLGLSCERVQRPAYAPDQSFASPPAAKRSLEIDTKRRKETRENQVMCVDEPAEVIR